MYTSIIEHNPLTKIIQYVLPVFHERTFSAIKLKHCYLTDEVQKIRYNERHCGCNVYRSIYAESYPPIDYKLLSNELKYEFGTSFNHSKYPELRNRCPSDADHSAYTSSSPPTS